MIALPILHQLPRRQPLQLAASLLLGLLLAACSTPASRIKSHPDIFAQADTEQQAMIRGGQIALGFPPEWVKLALGEPDRITERTDAQGTETVWHYTDIETVGGYGAFAYGYPDPFGYPPPYSAGYGPWWYGPPYPGLAAGYYPGGAAQIESDRLRVTFRAGKVAAIERVVKD